MDMKVVHYFVKLDKKGKVQNQGVITIMPTDAANGEGFYFDWILGDICQEFIFTDGFINEIILFNNDSEMKSFIKSNEEERAFA
jgi:hypothetical protein